MTEPRTEAGKRLADDFVAFLDGVLSLIAKVDKTRLPGVLQVAADGRDKARQAVLAIEDEAARAAVEAKVSELRAAVVGLDGTVVLGGRGIGTIHEPTRAAVLRLLEPGP